MAGYIPGFDVVRIDAHGFRVPVVTGTVTLENLTTIASPYTRAISADGVVAGGSLTGSPGDIIEVSHATYPETCQFVLTATQDEAYTSTQNANITYVAENLDTRETPAKVGELFAIDTDNPTVPPIKIASIRPGETVLVPEQLLQSTVERNYEIKLVTQDELSQKTGFDLSTAATDILTVPANGGVSSSDLATTTELLTGTNTTKVVTPDVMAALWEQGPDITAASTISIGEGGQFNITGTTPITDVDFATDKAGRTGWFKMAAATLLTIGASLILPGGQNITSAAGDVAAFRSEGADVVRCISYMRAANFPRTQKEVYLEQFGHTSAGFAAAIAAIGSTPTRLMVTENVTLSSSASPPVTLKIVPLNGAIITISGSSTLTIANFEDPGHVQCFAGVSASNHVVFAAGAVGEFKLTWYVGKTGGSGVNCTYAMTDLLTSCTTNEGGVILALPGDWHVDNLTLVNYITIQGYGGMAGSAGTVWKKYTASAGYIFQYVGLFRNINIKDCVIDVGSNTTVYGLYGYDAAGQSGFGMYLENVSFKSPASAVPAIIIDAPTGGGYAYAWETTWVLNNCTFELGHSTSAFKSLGFNSLATFTGCRFFVGYGASNTTKVIWAYQLLQLKMTGCYFGGGIGGGTYPVINGAVNRTVSTTVSGTSLTVPSGLTADDIGCKIGGGTDRILVALTSSTTGTLSASGSNWSATSTDIYRWTPGTNPTTAIQTEACGNISIDNCCFEGFENDYVHNAPYFGAPISLTNNLFQGKLQFNASTVVNLTGNQLYSLALNDANFTGVKIYATGNTWEKAIVYNNTVYSLSKVKEWGPDHDGSGIIYSQLDYIEGDLYMKFNERLEIVERFSTGAPDDALLRVGIDYYDISTDGQVLFELCTKNIVTGVPEFGWNFRRSPAAASSGYGRWEALQADPKFNSMTFGFAIGYDHTTRQNVTQTTSRTTGVTLPTGTYHGYITLYSTGSLGPGASSVFTVTSNLVYAGDQPEVWVASGSSTDLVTAHASNPTANTFKVLVFNHSATTADSGTIVLGYKLWKGGGSLGV